MPTISHTHTKTSHPSGIRHVDPCCSVGGEPDRLRTTGPSEAARPGCFASCGLFSVFLPFCLCSLNLCMCLMRGSLFTPFDSPFQTPLCFTVPLTYQTTSNLIPKNQTCPASITQFVSTGGGDFFSPLTTIPIPNSNPPNTQIHTHTLTSACVRRFLQSLSFISLTICHIPIPRS